MKGKSKLLLTILSLSVILSFSAMYYNFIVLENYVVFTDPETIPEPTDAFGYMINYFQQ